MLPAPAEVGDRMLILGKKLIDVSTIGVPKVICPDRRIPLGGAVPQSGHVMLGNATRALRAELLVGKWEVG